jgi:hypothetical protein
VAGIPKAEGSLHPRWLDSWVLLVHWRHSHDPAVHENHNPTKIVQRFADVAPPPFLKAISNAEMNKLQRVYKFPSIPVSKTRKGSTKLVGNISKPSRLRIWRHFLQPWSKTSHYDPWDGRIKSKSSQKLHNFVWLNEPMIQ